MRPTISVNNSGHVTDSLPIPDESVVNGSVIVHVIISDLLPNAIPPDDFLTVPIDACTCDSDLELIVIDNFRGAYKAVSCLYKQRHAVDGLNSSKTRTVEHSNTRERRRRYLRI